jgi:hypothetical protein
MLSRAVVILALFVAASGCSRPLRNAAVLPGPPASEAELWQEPVDLETRDLYYGPGGSAAAPAQTTFEFISADTTGYSPGYEVRDAAGNVWSVKLGKEAQPEIVTSRILWALGFHQPASYYVPSWTLTGRQAGPQQAARFRLEPKDVTVVDDWSWYENPFVGSRAFKGLVVANLIMTNWDWKTSNNKIYEYRDGTTPSRRYVVRDLGASLGRFTSPALMRAFRLRGMQGTRNNVDDFEQQGFITRMTESDVEFDYKGIYGDVVDSVDPGDVVWATRLLSRLSDKQWADAFRAAGYDETEADRFIRKIKAKIDEGLSFARRSEIR